MNISHIATAFILEQRNFDKLQLPQVRTETAHNSFHFQGPTLWNSLPSHIRSVSGLQTFKKLLKTYVILLITHAGANIKKSRGVPVFRYNYI